MQWRMQPAYFDVIQVFVAAVLSPGLLIAAKAKHLGRDNSLKSGTDTDDSEISSRERAMVTIGQSDSSTPTASHLENDIFGRRLLERPETARPGGAVTLKGNSKHVVTGQTESVTTVQSLNEVPIKGKLESEVISQIMRLGNDETTMDASHFTYNPENEISSTKDPSYKTAAVEYPEYETITTKESEDEMYEAGSTTEHKYSIGITEESNRHTDFTNDPNSRSWSSENTKTNPYKSGLSGLYKKITTPKNKTPSKQRTETGAWDVAAGVLGSMAIVIVVVTGSCFVYLTRKQTKKVYAEHLTFTMYQKAPPDSADEVELTAEAVPQSSPSPAPKEITFDVQSNLDVQRDVLGKEKCVSDIQKSGLEGQGRTLAGQVGSLTTAQGGLDKKQGKESLPVLKTKQRKPVTPQGDLDIKTYSLEMTERGLQGKMEIDEGGLNTQEDKSEKPHDGYGVQKSVLRTKGHSRPIVRHVSFV